VLEPRTGVYPNRSNMRAMYSPSKLVLVSTAICLLRQRKQAGIRQRCQKG